MPPVAITPRYTLISGSFYILYPDLPNNGPEPDGDTINFLPDHDELILALPRFSGRAPDRRHLGTYGVRFEGIDTLETHFENRHQKLAPAEAARDRMLELAGFRDVRFLASNRNKVQSAEEHPLRGHLLANGIESNGRVLGLVYPGDSALGVEDGDRVFVDEALLGRSLNAALVREGLAYAELYSTMPLALMLELRRLIAAARAAGAGHWPTEDVTRGRRAQIGGLADLSSMVIFPKLFRRLVKYFRAGFPDLASFDTWMRADPIERDDRALLPTGEIGNLHDLYDVGPGGMELNFLPEELTFDPDPA
jgi:hypothetical protein